jgi:REP element-mobilizing transposase RayT
MPDPVALFLTWTTYGTWLPGDARGHVSNSRNPAGGFRRKQNRPGTPYAAGDAYTRQRAQSLQKWATVWLTESNAVIVANSLVRISLEHEWIILRASIMPNHLHAVLTGCPMKGATVRRILKGNAQADLSAAVGESRRWWTAGGSDRVRHGERSIQATVQYVANQPGKLVEIIDNTVIVVRSTPK